MKTEKAKKSYINEAGEKTRSPTAQTVAQVYEFSHGKKYTVKLSDFNQEVLSCAAWHGLGQKLVDCFAGAASSADAEDKFADQLDALGGGNGRWLAERESAGPRISLVAEALHRVKSAKYHTVAAASEEVATWSAEDRKAKLSIPALAKAIAKIKAERLLAEADKVEDTGHNDL